MHILIPEYLDFFLALLLIISCVILGKSFNLCWDRDTAIIVLKS